MASKASSKIRIYTIAKQLEMQPKELADICKAAGLDIKSHSSTVNKKLAEQIKMMVRTGASTLEDLDGDLAVSREKKKEKKKTKKAPAAEKTEAGMGEQKGGGEPSAAVAEASEAEVAETPPGEPTAETASAEAKAAEAVTEPVETAEAPTEKKIEKAEAEEEVVEKPEPKAKARPPRPIGFHPRTVPAPKPKVEVDTSDVQPAPPPPPRGEVQPAPPPTPKNIGREREATTPASERPKPARRGPAPSGPAETGRGRGRRGRGRREERGERQDKKVTKRTIVFKRQTQAVEKPKITEAELEPPVTVKSLSAAIGIRVAELIKQLLLKYKVRANINSVLDEETIQLIGLENEVDITVTKPQTVASKIEEVAEIEERPEDLEARPPVVTFLGHVDHGKTSLLDRIIEQDIVSTEAGGITQDIRAHQITAHDQKITFIDTPGHEAFTAMRAQGAQVTDIVVLVIAADDGVMPQTEEAISHARAAEVPIVVAINKVDKADANVLKTKQQLASLGITPEDWGGEVGCVEVSALLGDGMEDLLERILLEAELLELKANPERPAQGAVLEAYMLEGLGVAATVLVQNGTLKIGDVVLCGACYGRIRSIEGTRGQQLQLLGPSEPGRISALNEVPPSGERLFVMPDIEKARQLAQERTKEVHQTQALSASSGVTLENFMEHLANQQVNELNVVIKADVLGTLEPILAQFSKLEHPEVRVRVLHQGVGGVNESDVVLAAASNGIIIAFRVTPDDRARELAEQKDVEIRRYNVIYNIVEDMRAALEGMLKPELKEVRLGFAEVRKIFKISRIGTIAGCRVREGRIVRRGSVRVIRDNRVIYEGQIQNLKREKDDYNEVPQGYECGIKIANYDDIKEGDVIECFTKEEVKQRLEIAR